VSHLNEERVVKKILFLLTMLVVCSGLYAKPVPPECKIKSQEDVIQKIDYTDGALYFLEEICQHWKSNKKVMLAAVEQNRRALQYVDPNIEGYLPDSTGSGEARWLCS
jgi:hypothetical protein